MKQNLSIQTLGQRQRLLEWSKKVADCRQSGMSVKWWCTENGTTPKTYYSWQKKVFEVKHPIRSTVYHTVGRMGCSSILGCAQDAGCFDFPRC